MTTTKAKKMMVAKMTTARNEDQVSSLIITCELDTKGRALLVAHSFSVLLCMLQMLSRPCC